MITTPTVLAGPPPSAAKLTGFRSSFYLVVALLMAGAGIYGFSRTIDDKLIHPNIARPPAPFVHGVLFGAWILFYVLQTALIRAGGVRLHRRLGQACLCIGAAIPVVGVATAIGM